MGTDIDGTVSDLNWDSTISTDYDDDGCQDIGEDDDDDNDSQLDIVDNCDPDTYLNSDNPIGRNGNLDWTSDSTGDLGDGITDYDGDGCQDNGEDRDDVRTQVILSHTCMDSFWGKKTRRKLRRKKHGGTQANKQTETNKQTNKQTSKQNIRLSGDITV